MLSFFSIGANSAITVSRLHGQAFRRATRLLTAVAFGLFATLAISQDGGASLADAQKFLKQGKHAAALNSVDSYLAQNPKDAQGRFLKGLILTEQEKLDEATTVFVGLTVDYPELPEPYNNLAVLYAQQRQYDKARTALEMAIRTHPAYAIAYENLGDVYAKLASQAYDRALQIDSGNSAAQGKLSLIRELFGTTARNGRASAGKPASDPVRTAAAKPTAKPAPAQPVASQAPAAEKPKAAPVAAASAAAKSAPITVQTSGASPIAENPRTLQEITQTLESWAQAWSNKNVPAYLSHYHESFTPDDRTTHADWKSSRTIRVGKPGDIEVSIADVRVELNADGQATARFYQRYRSNNLNSNTNKTMVLKRTGDRWVIVEERLG